MKKRLGMKVGLATCTWLIYGVLCSVHAQTAGSNVVSAGWVCIAPQAKGTPLRVTNIDGTPVDILEAGSGSGAKKTNTFGVSVEHYITDYFGLKLAGGMPVYLDLTGRGTLARYGVIGEAKPWSPMLLASYHFGEATNRLRPFVSAGITYTWFSDEKITNQNFITDNLGPGGSIKVGASNAWKPVVEAGANYALADRWALGLVVTYIPVRTEATLDGETATGMTSTTVATIRLRPILPFLNMSYRF